MNHHLERERFVNNGYKIKLGITIGSLFFFIAVGYTEVRIRSVNNEKNHIEYKKETSENIKEIKKDQTTLLVQQTRILTILEDLKRSSN